MRKALVYVALLTILACGVVSAQEAGTKQRSASSRSSDFGLGVIIGEPTGISGKLWLSGGTAIDGAVAWSSEKHADFQIHADYLVHKFNVISVRKGRLPLYYGIGGRLRTWDGDHDNNVGVRFPVGLDYLIAGAPLDIFFELVPILDIAPDTDLEFNGALGIRYWF